MARTLPILTFHALDEMPSAISFRPRLFRDAIQKLRDHGYRTVRLHDAVQTLRAKQALPDRSVVITFDDGYASVAEVAWPVLVEAGITATVFLTVGRSGRASADEPFPSLSGRRMLNWRLVREMHAAGIDFGAHTLTHPDLTRLSPAQAEEEIVRSKEIVQDGIGDVVTCFAYPYGRSASRHRAIAAEHFAGACSDRLGLMNDLSDPWALERVDAYYLRTAGLFDLLFMRWFPWYIRARNVPRELRRGVKRAKE